MVYENDKFNIPEKYLKMSEAELDRLIEKEKKKHQEDIKNGRVEIRRKSPMSVKVNWN